MKSIDNFNKVFLSKDVDIEKYQELEFQQNKIEISRFIYNRFYERYIEPLENVPTHHKNGFSIMLVCCPMIEALESLRHGYSNTSGKSKSCFKDFFEKSKYLHEFVKFEHFYEDIRCGILHQTEVRNGWRILRMGDLRIPLKSAMCSE